MKMHLRTMFCAFARVPPSARKAIVVPVCVKIDEGWRDNVIMGHFVAPIHPSIHIYGMAAGRPAAVPKMRGDSRLNGCTTPARDRDRARGQDDDTTLHRARDMGMAFGRRLTSWSVRPQRKEDGDERECRSVGTREVG